MFTLRRATLGDSSLLFEWRNDPLTRENSINSDPVPLAMHEKWLASSLENPSRTLFVGMDSGQPVGTARLDRTASYIEISYTVAPSQRHKGYGQMLVNETLKHCALPVKASVKPQNAASRRILEKSGFRPDVEENGLLIYGLRKE